MLRQILLATIICFSLSSAGVAANTVEEMFHENFLTQYTGGRCFQNSLNFARAVESEFSAAESLTLVSLKNVGFSTFGMINAEKTRGSRFEKLSVEESNWYHHVFIMDEKGYVYDFDFGIEPNVIHISEYLEDMYLNEPECTKKGFSGRFCGGRKSKLTEYEFTAVNAKIALQGKDKPEVKVYMQAIVDDWQVLLSGNL